MDPDSIELAVQNNLRDSRSTSRRFVQAAGTLARALGGQLLTGANSDALISKYFASIQPAPRERDLPRHEQFGYDFIKAILLWLDSGPGAVVEGFSSRSSSDRLPIPQDSDMDAIDDYLVPYLLELASEEPIVDVDVSRFEKDDTRVLMSSEKDAVIAFSHAIRIPFADLTGALVPTSGDTSAQNKVQDRDAAKRRWAYQIGRGILRNAAKHIRFSFVDRAFGGRGYSENKIKAEEQALREQQEDIDTLNDDGPVVDAELVHRGAGGEQSGSSSSTAAATRSRRTIVATVDEDDDEDEATSDADDDEDEEEDEEEDSEEDEDADDTDGDVVFEEDDDSDDEDDEGLRRTRSGRMLWRSNYGLRGARREKVELDVPCAPHTRVYTGHCNVKTVKDVNYFGLQDEYVVSGSDDGNIFIWDRKTAQLVNILEGDGEVVNVVQGKPLVSEPSRHTDIF